MKARYLLWFLTYLTFSSRAQQVDWQDGAFSTVTGRELYFDEWMSLLPEEFDLFASNEPLQMGIESDFKALNKNKFKDEYQDALLSVPIADTAETRRIIRIKPRGEFRRKTCNPPPIKLNFKKMERFTESIQELEKMKMVSQCKNTRIYQEYVMKEYLAYKMYNVITDLSFNARLLDMKFIDNGRNDKVTKSYVFLIEEVDDIEKRKNLVEVETKTASPKDVYPEDMVRMALFNYMIGNTDWSITGLHNVKLFKDEKELIQKAHLVPYDFDYSGFVNASYAIPSDNFGLKTVRERLLRCPCYSDDIFSQGIQEFIDNEAEIFRIINEFDLLSSKAKSDVVSFTNQFFSQMKGKGALRFMKDNCGKLL